MKEWRGLKVLPLPTWLRWSRYPSWSHITEETLSGYQETKPLLRRNGHYYHKGIEWMECDGRAYLVPEGKSSFLYELKIMNAPVLRAVELEALRVLQHAGLLSCGQRGMLYMIDCAEEQRRAYRNACKWGMRLRKRGESNEDL